MEVSTGGEVCSAAYLAPFSQPEYDRLGERPKDEERHSVNKEDPRWLAHSESCGGSIGLVRFFSCSCWVRARRFSPRGARSRRNRPPGSSSVSEFCGGVMGEIRFYRVVAVDGLSVKLKAEGEPIIADAPSSGIIRVSDGIASVTGQIKADSSDACAYLMRSLLWLDKRELDIALGDTNDAVRLARADPSGVCRPWGSSPGQARVRPSHRRFERSDPPRAAISKHLQLARRRHGLASTITKGRSRTLARPFAASHVWHAPIRIVAGRSRPGSTSIRLSPITTKRSSSSRGRALGSTAGVTHTS